MKSASHPLSPGFFEHHDRHQGRLPDVDGLWSGKSPWVGEVERATFASMASAIPEEDRTDAFWRARAGFHARAPRSREAPFLLVISLMKPHPLFAAPPAFAARAHPSSRPPARGRPDRPAQTPAPAHRLAGGASLSAACGARARATANLAYVDTCIGRILDLEGSGVSIPCWRHLPTSARLDGDHGLYRSSALFEPAFRGAAHHLRPRSALPRPRRQRHAGQQVVCIHPRRRGCLSTQALALQVAAPAAARLDVTASPHPLLRGSAAQPRRPPSANSTQGDHCRAMKWCARAATKYVHSQGSTREFYDLEARVLRRYTLKSPSTVTCSAHRRHHRRLLATED